MDLRLRISENSLYYRVRMWLNAWTKAMYDVRGRIGLETRFLKSNYFSYV